MLSSEGSGIAGKTGGNTGDGRKVHAEPGCVKTANSMKGFVPNKNSGPQGRGITPPLLFIAFAFEFNYSPSKNQ